MTNQEAIEFLKNMIDREAIGFVCTEREGDVAIWQYHVEALQMAISALQAQEETVSRKVYEQISWERDIAVMQLKDLGYGLGEKIRTDGDTISRQDAIECLEHLSACDEPFVEIGTDDETFIRKYEAITEISDLPSAQSQYTDLTPEEAASEIASGSIMSASYWLDAMIRLKQMGYAICRKKG